MDVEFEQKWEKVRKLSIDRFGEVLEVESMLFIIGLQELAHGHRKLTKDQKVDVIHVAICSLLEPFGYYVYEGRDKEDWPHWSVNEKLPNLQPKEQARLIREAIINYFGV